MSLFILTSQSSYQGEGHKDAATTSFYHNDGITPTYEIINTRVILERVGYEQGRGIVKLKRVGDCRKDKNIIYQVVLDNRYKKILFTVALIEIHLSFFSVKPKS